VVRFQGDSSTDFIYGENDGEIIIPVTLILVSGALERTLSFNVITTDGTALEGT